DVADGALDALHVRSDALVTLAAHARGPAHRGAFADLRFPFGARLGEIVRPDERGAGAVGAVHDADRGVGEVRAGVERGDGGVIPLRDLAEEDVREHRARELELPGL